jgi:hypothetical protein
MRARNDINVATNILLEAQSRWTDLLQLHWPTIEGGTGFVPRWTDDLTLWTTNSTMIWSCLMSPSRSTV